MKISVITATFNAARTIEATLESVRIQTHPDKEHILIDGASTDDTLAIAARHRGNFSHIVSEADRGIYDAMNKGIVLASGDIIALLNADDHYVHPDVLARVAQIMESEPLDALYGDVEFFHPGDPARIVRRYRSSRFSPQRIAWGWMPAHPALFLRRKVYEQFGMFRTDMKIAADFDFIARIFYRTNLRHRHLPEVLVRMQTGGVSTGGLRNTWLLNKEVLRACRENGIRTNMLKILSKYPLKALDYLPQ